MKGRGGGVRDEDRNKLREERGWGREGEGRSEGRGVRDGERAVRDEERNELREE